MLEKEYKFADPTSEVIFHAYPQSPVAEKVRVVFASKDLNGAAWKFRVHALEVLHKNSSVRAGFEGRQADTRRFCSQVAIPLPRGVRTQQSAPGVGHAGKTGQGQQGQGG